MTWGRVRKWVELRFLGAVALIAYFVRHINDEGRSDHRRSP